MTPRRVALAGIAFASLALAVPAAGAAPAVRTVEMTAHWSRYTPSVISARKATVLRLVVTNLDPIDHELIVGDQAVQDLHEHGTDTHHDSSGEISMPAHSVVVTRWLVTGSTMFGCHMPGHWAYGMQGVIVAS